MGLRAPTYSTLGGGGLGHVSRVVTITPLTSLAEGDAREGRSGTDSWPWACRFEQWADDGLVVVVAVQASSRAWARARRRPSSWRRWMTGACSRSGWSTRCGGGAG